QETEEALAKSARADAFDPTGLELSRVVGPVLTKALQRHRPPAISNPRGLHLTRKPFLCIYSVC
ncbi:MAG: hypothetical protein WC423_12185, partial [Vulcanimicrobiota bacterium]